MVMMSRCTIEWSRRGIVKELMEEWSFRLWRRLEGEGEKEEDDDVVDDHHHVQSRVEEELWRKLRGDEEGEKEAEEDNFDG